MFIDRLEHATGLLHKLKFFLAYRTIFFLIETCFRNGKLLVVFNKYKYNFKKYKSLTSKYIRSLSRSISFLSTSVMSPIIFPVILLSKRMVLLSTHQVTKHLTCCSGLSCNLILKIKIIREYFYFSSATFWFWSIKIWYLKLSIQVQALEAIIKNWFKKICLEIWNYLQNIHKILLKMYYKIKSFQVYSLQSVSVLSVTKWYTNSKN